MEADSWLYVQITGVFSRDLELYNGGYPERPCSGHDTCSCANKYDEVAYV